MASILDTTSNVATAVVVVVLALFVREVAKSMPQFEQTVEKASKAAQETVDNVSQKVGDTKTTRQGKQVPAGRFGDADLTKTGQRVMSGKQVTAGRFGTEKRRNPLRNVWLTVTGQTTAQRPLKKGQGR